MEQTGQGVTGGQLPSIPDYNLKVCVPVYSDTCDNHKMSLMETERAGIKFTYQVCQSALPALARNLLINEDGKTTVRQTLKGDYTHYLFIDADIAWRPQDILQLLARRRHIVSGSYVARGTHDCYQAGRWEHAVGNPGELVKRNSTGMHKVDWVGGGFLMVTKMALEHMNHPWFRHRLVEIDEDVGEGKVIRHAIEANEDCGFCLNAVKSGVPVYLDCDTEVEHVTEFDVPPLRLTPPATPFEVTKEPSGPGIAIPASMLHKGSDGASGKNG